MADKNLSIWHQGKRGLSFPNCDSLPAQTCPTSKQIAAEYDRGHFTLTNVLVANLEGDDFGAELPVKELVAGLEATDTLWFAVVPPMCRVHDAFGYADEQDAGLMSYGDDGASALINMDGYTLTLVGGIFKKATEKDECGNGVCPVSNVEELGTLTFDDSGKKQFTHKAFADKWTEEDEWFGVGFRIDALPSGKTLADIYTRLVAGVHATDTQAQLYI